MNSHGENIVPERCISSTEIAVQREGQAFRLNVLEERPKVAYNETR